MATSVTAALGKVIKEEIPRGIREQRIKIDPAWSKIFTSSQGVKRDGLGRDWKFLQMFTAGISGAYEFKANSVLVGKDLAFNSGEVSQFAEGNIWPGRAETTAPTFFESTVTLKEARGNLAIPIKWLQLDEFDSSVGSAVRVLLQGAGRKAALAHAIAFYTTDATDFRVVTLKAVSGSASSHTIEIDNSDAAKANGRIQMLHVGQTVDIYSSADALQNTDTPWVITMVDYINQKFKIEKLTGSDEDLAVDDYLTLRNSRGNQPSGLLSWIKDASAGSQTVFGIDLDVHPQFGSLVVTESGPLTEKMLNKHIGSFMDRVGTMCELDTILTPAAVIHSYLENEDNLMYYERNGRRLNLKGGWTDVTYAYNGDGFTWGVSSFIEPKSCYVLKLGGKNIQEYVPPTTPGTGRKSEFDNEIQFVAQLGGATGVFLHERDSSSNITDNIIAPYFRICELAPQSPQSIRITGLDESES